MACSNVVVLIANGAYVPAAFATAASILAQGLREDISIAIVQPPAAMTREQRLWFETSYPRIEHVEIEASAFLPAAIASWDTAVACQMLRFALAEIFPAAQKILYVDADILAFRRIDDLFGFDLRNKLVAAAHNNLIASLIGPKPSWIAYRNALGVPMETPYLNGGVLLMDAVAWRASGTRQTLVDLFLAHRELCRNLDQSVLNLYLQGDFAPLSPAWNFQQTYQAIAADDIVQPRLVHFAGTAKPWRNNGFVYRRAFRNRYREILEGSPFASFFKPYWKVDRKQSREAWRSLRYTLGGREIQSGIRRTDIPRLRAAMQDIMATYDFIDEPRAMETVGP